MRIATLTLAIAMTLGCAKQYEVITAPEQETMEHYVVVQATKSGGMKMWDCRTYPDDASWDPTCVRVRMQNSAREQAE